MKVSQKIKWNDIIDLAQKANEIAKKEEILINGIMINGICAVMTDGANYNNGEYVEIDEIDDDDRRFIEALQITIDSETNGDYIRITKADMDQAIVMLTNIVSEPV